MIYQSPVAPVVSDASCLIALPNIEQVELLRRLWPKVVVPPAVAR